MAAPGGFVVLFFAIPFYKIIGAFLISSTQYRTTFEFLDAN
jgi:hypothetical protein